MSFIKGRSLPTILFVGRPGDSRKGITTLLDAVEQLNGYTAIPENQVWLVGGSEREVAAVSAMVDSHPALALRRRAGTLVLWGRVQNAALPELYSRATVTVLPSWREEFGIVAVEAMMCGCAVVASRAGGLSDIIVHGVTGTLVPVDDSAALAATLAAYLRCPARAALLGRNAARFARMRFSQETVYAQVRALYGGEEPPQSAPAEGDPLRFADLEAYVAASSSLLGTALENVQPIADGQHSVFAASALGARVHVKAFRDRASLMAALLPEAPFPTERPASLAWNRTVYNDGNPAAPEVVAWETEAGAHLVVTRWIDAEPLPPGPESDAVVTRLAEQCRAFRPLEDDAMLAEYNARLDALEGRECDALRRFDEFAVRLNEPVTGGFRAFARIHPQVELMRIRQMVDDRVWCAPGPLASRVRALTGLLLQRPLSRRAPRLAQGDPKPEHYLHADGITRACDFEHSLYAVGPLDEAYWIATVCYTRGERPSSRPAIRRLRAICIDEESLYLACCWLCAEIVYRSMVAYMDGDGLALDKAKSFLADFATEWLLG
jgi:hypothetical protein